MSFGRTVSITGHQHSWPPSASHTHHTIKSLPHRDDTPARSQTSNLLFDDAIMADPAAVQSEGDNVEEEAQRAMFRELYERTESRIDSLFNGTWETEQLAEEDVEELPEDQLLIEEAEAGEPAKDQGPKKVAREIDEDNYDDEDDDEQDEIQPSPLKSRSTNTMLSPSKSGSSPVRSDSSSAKHMIKEETSQEQPKTSEDARKRLEETKKATEDAVKRSFHTTFYTLENDRVAMLEQQKLEESEKQIDAEMDNGGTSHTSGPNGEQHGSLSSANLGASSLTLKHLIARIDLKRDQVRASDAELRSLMNEVRKNRSKWASEENVHQEELYEAAEKVLSELKAMTEYSAPFLTRVNKRDAPDYYNSEYCLCVTRSIC